MKKLWKGAFPLNRQNIPIAKLAETKIIQRPDDCYGFLHDCMIESFHGDLFAAWYNCPIHEMAGTSVIRGKVSHDDGRSWSNVKLMAEDHSGKYMYVPPAFGICPKTDRLYLFASRMVGADLVHDFDLFVLDERSGIWSFVRRFDEPFLPNTRVMKMANGKLIMGGRLSVKADDYPEIPAVAINDSGCMDAPWRIVKIQDMVKAPDRENYLPETVLIIEEKKVTAFVRHDNRYPVLYESLDYGESWSCPIEFDIPVGYAKAGAGLLSDKRRYLLTNIAGEKRNSLVLYLSLPNEEEFSEAFLIRDGADHVLDARPEWSYPVAVEHKGKLVIIYTSEKKSAAVTMIPLK